MKRLIITWLLLMAPLIVNAEMVELPIDDDPVQYWTFENCNPDSFTAVIVGHIVDPDSGTWLDTLAITDTFWCELEIGNRPWRDAEDNLIPGDYFGEYWIMFKYLHVDGETYYSGDVYHQQYDYHVGGGCGEAYHGD